MTNDSFIITAVLSTRYSVTWLARVTLSACPSLEMKKALADSTLNPQLQAYCLMIITQEHKVDNFFTVRNSHICVRKTVSFILRS